MADTIVSAVGIVAGPIIENLISLLERRFRLIREVGKDAEKLLRTLSTIKIILEDAEARQLKNKQILEWLEMLKNAAYDAEDVLDAWSVKIQQRELDFTNGGCSSQVSHSISTCLNLTEVLFRCKMAEKMKEMINTFDDIAEQKNKFHLNTNVEPQNAYEFGRETSSIISEPKIYGRDNDQENIINILLGHESSQECVLPILGFGGVGKTTLAKLVHNCERVTKSFEVRIWVCVSEPFDVKRILKAIVEFWDKKPCNLVTLESIQSNVKEILKNKKYFVVLDDVWNQNEHEWNKLRSSFSGGAKGSSVLVTTRSPTVASITGTVSPYRLGVLSDDDCWSLLKHHALRDMGEEEHQNLVSIGKEIVKRCKGLPLAAKSLGSLLRSKTEEMHWENVRDDEIWNLEVEGDNDILPALRLSYNHLPSNLKQCFAYCSVYPKDDVIDKTELIRLWIANGFIQLKGKMGLEEIGDGIFNELLQWSFFQDTREAEYGNIETCKMHDLMHDLASSIARNDCRIVNIYERPNVPKRIRHLNMIHPWEQSSTAFNPAFLKSIPSLRTLQLFGFSNIDGCVFQRTLRVLHINANMMKALPPSVFHLKQLRYLSIYSSSLRSLPKSICRLINLQTLDLTENRDLKTLPSLIGMLEHLRYLSLSGTNIASLPVSICRLRNLRWLALSHNEEFRILPHSIGNLTNLRHLDLTDCASLESLPETVCDLMNLQSLLLSFCENLKELPKNMKNMRRLIHLNILCCWKLRKLPGGIGELTSLRTLGYFPVAVGDDSDRRDGGGCRSAAGFSELQGLNQLGRELIIGGLENVGNAEEARMANLSSKHYVTQLVLKWSYDEDDEDNGSLQVINNNNQEVLQGLLPRLPPNFQLLAINGYGAVEFPPRILQGEGGGGVLNTTLQSLEIGNCPKLKCLPAEIGDLAALKSLEIFDCKELISLPQEVQKLTSLTKLSVRGCNSIKCFPTIGGGGGVGSEGLRYLTSLKELEISECPELKLESGTRGFEHLISLETLKLEKLPKFTALPQGIRHLVHLKLYNLPQLTALPDAIQHLPMLQALHILGCKNLRTLPDWFKHLTTLQSLNIYHCHPDLQERCRTDEGEDWHKISHIPKFYVGG